MRWPRQVAAPTRLPPLASALLFVAGCASDPESIDPRTATAAAAPTPAEWRMAASGIAAEIAAALQRRNGNWLVSLRPVEGVDAPANLDDLLLAEMVQAGVPVAAENGADAALQCRVSATGTTERPRGVTAASVDPTAQTMLVCLLATGGRYVWAAHRTLRPRAPAPSAAPGTILEITG